MDATSLAPGLQSHTHTVAGQRASPASRGGLEAAPESPQGAPARAPGLCGLCGLRGLLRAMHSFSCSFQGSPFCIPQFPLHPGIHFRVDVDVLDAASAWERRDGAAEGARDHSARAHNARRRPTSGGQFAQTGGAERVAAARSCSAGQATGRAAFQVVGPVADAAVELAMFRQRGQPHEELHACPPKSLLRTALLACLLA